MMRRILATGALLALALCACTKVGDTGTTGSTAAAGAHGDRLIIGTNADPKGLNPAFAAATPTLELSAFIFSYTVRYDDHAKPVPDAVTEIPTIENGDVSKDGLTLKYKLRHGLKWHDGIGEVQCKDMRATWKMMINPKNIIDTTVGWKSIKDIDCSDPYVAVVHMSEVYAPYLQQLWSVNGNSPILPEHVLAKYDDAQGSMNKAPFNSAPIGSGPYKFVSWERSNQVRLEAFPDYYAGKPAIREIIYKIIPDGNTLATQVQTHELNVAWNLPAGQYDRIKAVPGTTVIAPVVYIFDHIDFNLRRPMFADVRVRRALTYAIDRKSLLEKVQHGLGELSDTFLDPTLYPDAQDPNIMKYPFDLAKAKALLDEAGWVPGPDGIRVKNGQKLAFQLSATTESTTAHLVQAQVQTVWRSIGADAEVKNYPTTLFFDQTANGVLAGGKYDVGIYAWGGAADIDQSAIYSAHFLPPHGQNYPVWQNQRATQAMDDANRTVDQAKRIADYHIVQEEFAKDDFSVILWFRKYVIAYANDLKELTPTPVITTPFWNTWAYHY
jgi:peptide/nickel transport system substrate-binding protein